MIEVSDAAAALQSAIRTVCYGGRVVVMSWYREPIAQLNLADEFHHNRVQLVSSQADALNPALTPSWSTDRRRALAAELVGELELAPLFTHDFPVERAADAYRIVDRAAEGVIQCTISYRGNE